MGTRADFYVGRGINAEWIGSIAMDGYPEGIPAAVFRATTADEFRREALAHINSVSHGTLPEQGWPWPWEDSSTSDYGYCFARLVEDPEPIFPGVEQEGRHVWWHQNYREVDGESVREPGWHNDAGDFLAGEEEWPNMKSRQNVTLGPRSGLLVFGVS